MHKYKNAVVLQEQEELIKTISTIFNLLNSGGSSCAIRRNPERIGIPLEGDVDILIDRKCITEILHVLKETATLLRVKISYGGLKAWVMTTAGHIKEIDFIWRVAKQGIILLDHKELKYFLSAYTENVRGIPVLTDEGIGQMIFAEKKSVEDYEKYKKQLGVSGFSYQGELQRYFRLTKTAIRSPIKTIISFYRWLSLLSFRIFFPVGVAVYCEETGGAEESRVLRYIFDNRIYFTTSWIKMIFYRNFLGGLVFTKKSNADFQITNNPSINSIERAIICKLRQKRVSIPLIQKILA